jgi:uncharacterized protein YkwD
MNLNWIDWVIVAFIGYHTVSGWEMGLVSLLGSLGAFFGSLLLAIRYSGAVGSFIRDKLGLSPIWTTVLGYLSVAFVTEIILAEVFALILARVPKKFSESKSNRWFGVIVSAANAVLIITFILLVLLALPLRGTIRQDIKSSAIGSRIVAAAQKFAAPLTTSVNRATQGAIEFLTVEPSSSERIALDVAPEASSLTVDAASEQTMLELVNGEREKEGLSLLTIDEKMREVARAHSRDMFVRRYFSHYDPEGKNAGDRLDAAGIGFMYAGENLAYAPDVATAHAGLMQSEGHRDNILDGHFHRVGIGVIDGGIYGKMFTQVFAD